MVLGYLDVLRDKRPVGRKVAILGAGGIGFDVAEYLTDSGLDLSTNVSEFLAQWGVDPDHRDLLFAHADAEVPGSEPGDRISPAVHHADGHGDQRDRDLFAELVGELGILGGGEGRKEEGCNEEEDDGEPSGHGAV